MAYNPQTDFLAALQRAQGNTGYENYGREYFDPTSGMNFMRGVGGTGQLWANQAGDQGGGGSMTHAMAGVGQNDMWRAYDGAAGREASDNFALNGLPYHMYGQDGSYGGQGTWEGLEENTIMEQLLPIGMLAAPFALTMMGAGGAAGAAGAAGGGSGAVGSGAGFVGEGALSGIGAWDGAMAGIGSGTGAMGAGAAGAAGLGGAGGGAAGGGGILSKIGGALGLGGAAGGGGSSLLGLGATALGALSGGQGQDASTSSTRAMDPRMQALFYGDLAPRTQGALGSQMGQAQTAGNQLMSVGGGLLGQTAPNTATNPYATGILDDLQRRQQQMIAESLQGVKGNAVGVGGLGGSRQGVAEAQAITQGADNFTGQAANFMGGLYNADQNRLRQDWTLGSGMLNQGVNMPFQPLQNTANVYQPFTGYGTTTNNAQSGGGWQGAVGGALAGASMGRQMGWW